MWDVKKRHGQKTKIVKDVAWSKRLGFALTDKKTYVQEEIKRT